MIDTITPEYVEGVIDHNKTIFFIVGRGFNNFRGAVFGWRTTTRSNPTQHYGSSSEGDKMDIEVLNDNEARLFYRTDILLSTRSFLGAIGDGTNAPLWINSYS